MKMKRIFLVILSAVMVIGLSTCPTPAFAKKYKYKVKIGGGTTGGTFNTFSNAMAIFLSKEIKDARFTSVGSGGSVENVKRTGTGESTFGLCYAVDSALGAVGKLPKDPRKYDKLRSVGYVYGAPAQLVVRAKSEINDIKDLVDRRIAMGNAGSGAAASSERFFRHLNLWEKIEPQFLGYSNAANAFKDGKIDAFWILTTYPNRSIIEASVQVPIRLVNTHMVAQSSGFYEQFPYAKTTIPAGTYKNVPVCITFEDSTLLSASIDVSEELVYRVTKALWSEKGMQAIWSAKKTFKGLNLENAFRGATSPLHPGAYKFWLEMGKEIPDHLKPVH